MFNMWKKSRLRLIKPADSLIFLIPFVFLFSLRNTGGQFVEIFSGNREVYVLSLSTDTVITVEGKIGKSKIEIKGGKVRMLYSPCPLKICEKQGFISREGQEIICVPNRIIIKIKGEKNIDEVTE